MNKTWKELLCMVLSAVMVLGLAACGSSKAEASAGDGDSTSGDTAADSIVLKMSTAQPEEHIASQTALRFADLIEQGTNGAVTVKMYFANSLGAQDVIVQGLMDGSIDLSLEFIDSTYNPVFEVQSLPFIASNFDEMEYIFSPGSQVYSLVDKGFSDIGIKLLGVYCEGLTGVSCKNMPESYNTWDQKKEPIRVWNSAVAKAGMTAMGYNTVAMTWSDTYSSIQTGIVNGSVGQTSLGVYTNLRDVVNYFIPYNFGAEFVHLAMSSTSWGKLTADQQKVVQDAATQVCKERAQHHHGPQRPPDATCGPGTGGQGTAHSQESHRRLHRPQATETGNADPPTGSHARLLGSRQSQRLAPHVLSGIGQRPAKRRTGSPAVGRCGHPK